MAYDTAHKLVILFGDHSAGRDGNTYAFDAVANNWQQMTPSVSPPKRGHGAMVYDIANDRCIQFGGQRVCDPDDTTCQQTQGPSVYGDTWAYDYANNIWEDRNPTGSPPSRQHQAMAYDAVTQKTYMYGGQQPGGAGNLADLAWVSLTFAGTEWFRTLGCHCCRGDQLKCRAHQLEAPTRWQRHHNSTSHHLPQELYAAEACRSPWRGADHSRAHACLNLCTE